MSWKPDETDAVLDAMYVDVELIIESVGEDGVGGTVVESWENAGAHAVALREGVDDCAGRVVAKVDMLVGVCVIGFAGEEVVWGDGVGGWWKESVRVEISLVMGVREQGRGVGRTWVAREAEGEREKSADDGRGVVRDTDAGRHSGKGAGGWGSSWTRKLWTRDGRKGG